MWFGRVLKLGLLGGIVALFWEFLVQTTVGWFSSSVFSYGVLIPAISAYLIWREWPRIKALEAKPWNLGLAGVLAGCALAVMGTLSGILLVSGVGLVAVLIGCTGFVWGSARARAIVGPVAFLAFMVPWPSYAMGSLTWQLQTLASTAGARILQSLGVVVFQNGNLLILPHDVLEVKEACSGTHSLFALLALATLMAFLQNRRWVQRGLLILSVPFVALAMNVVRIVGTGLLASRFSGLASNETLHMAWGVVIFLLASLLLVAENQGLQWVFAKFGWAR